MGRVGLFILLFATLLQFAHCADPKPQCKFTATNGFYAHVPSDLSIGEVVFNGSVSPPDAEMTIANVRSDAFKDTDWSDRVVIDRSEVSAGAYLVRLAASLSLPVYPSTLQSANLFVTVVCNGYAYPLFTVHIDPTNRFAPQFYHEPYVVAVQKDLPAGSVIETPVAAIDWDPAEKYNIRVWLEDAHKGLELVEERRSSSGLISGSDGWTEDQLPGLVRLRVTGPYQLPMSLRLIVSDNAKPPRKSTTFINLVEKLAAGSVIRTVGTVPPTTSMPTTTRTTSTVPTSSTTTTTTTPPPTTTTTTIPSTSTSSTTPENLPEIVLDSDVTRTDSPSDFTSSTFIPTTGTETKLTVDQDLVEKLKKTLEMIPQKKGKEEEEEEELDAIAFAAKNREMNAIEPDESGEIEKLSDAHPSEDQEPTPTRFAQCSLRTSIVENSPRGTNVARLEILNKTNTTTVRLIDPDGTFAIDNETDEIVVNDARLVDRELFSTLELVAEIENADPSVQCSRMRIYVDLDDANDNRPVFENENYFFPISENFPPGQEIGKLVAQDIDQGANGQITYHLMTADVPFQVGTQGKKAVLMSTGKMDPSVYSYNLSVEARDHGEIAKSARVPVEIFVLSSKIGKKDSKEEVKKVGGVKTNVVATTEAVPDGSEEDVEVVTVIEEVIEEVEEEETSEAPQTTTSGALEETFEPSEGQEEEEEEEPEAKVEEEEVEVEEEEEEPTVEATTTEASVSDSETDNTLPKEVEPPAIAKTFSFGQPEYKYDAFGMEIKENDVLGRVEAQPNVEFYAVDREVAGTIKINEMGEILAGRNLNRQSDGPIKFGISATNGFETTRAEVTVLRDANRDVMSAMPRFDRDTYRFEIKENQQPEVIGIVRAFHSALSSSETLHLTYSLIAPAQIDELPIEIHEQSGEVSTSRPLDTEQQRFYRFQVRACLTQTICSSSDVIVEVVDVNDNPPVLASRRLEATVESDVPPGTKIVKLFANDADSSGNNSRITFAITNENGVFSIDAITGQVTTSQTLTQPLYTLLIEASDNGVPRRSDTAEVTVTVRGTNPSPPAFDQEDYRIVIAAPVRAGQVIGTVRATDPDPGMEGMVTYKLMRADNEDHRKFSINSKTGVISAMEQLAIEDGPIELTVEASDNGKNSRRKVKTAVKIDIVDSKTLKFLPLPTTVYISTEKAVGSVVLRVSAISTEDENIKFRVLQDNSQFVMDGDLLRVSNHLVEGESILSIRAETDTVHIDHQLKVVVMSDRDKYPVFPQLTYDFDVSTDGHFPRVVHQFNAKLGNGTLRYTFFPPTPPQGFYLDEKSGELFVTSQFPAKNKDTAFVVVRAINQQDQKFYSDVGVAITPVSAINPTLRFQQSAYNFEVYESLPQGDAIGTISVTGGASNNIKFSLSPDNSFLGIHKNGTVYLAEKVDAEEMEDELVREFTVVASNGTETAKARIQVAVRDVNEFQPEFDESDIEMSVDTDAAPGTRIGRVQAHDKDVSEKNRLIYRVVGGSGRKLVFIQEDGTIIVGDEKIDPSLDSFDLIIEAVDRNGNHDSTHVNVFVEGSEEDPEEPPSFLGEPLVWNVTEGTTQSFELRATGSTTGSSSIRFKIVGGDADGHFDIVHLPEENTARLRIVSELDKRRQESYTLQVEARDERSQLSRVAEVTVNVIEGNEHAPQFTRDDYSGTIPSDITIGAPIVTIEAADVDRDPLEFSLQGELCEQQLSIDNRGRVAYRVPQHERTAGSVVCIVVVSDGVHSTNTNLRLRVTPPAEATQPPTPNRAPIFANAEFDFSIQRNAKAIGAVKATDPDGDILDYSIEPTEYRNLFHVASDGLVTILEPLHQQRYSFLVVAEDRGEPIMSSFTNVKVTVEPEEQRSEDNDNEVSLGAGVRTVPTEAPIARSSLPAPELQFSQSVYSWKVENGLPVGSIVGQVKLNQKDRADVHYSFISADFLSIDPEGRVAVLKPLTSTINDVVIATSDGNILAETRIFVAVDATTVATTTTEPPTTQTLAPLEESTYSTSQATTMMPISSARIVPMEIPKPGKFQFAQPNYFAFSAEGDFKNGIELEIKPEELKVENALGPVEYSIEDTTTRMPFFLNEHGKLIMFEADRERHSSYYFTIVAKTASQMARARLNVTILDVNDNYPRFEPHPEVIGVRREMHVGSPIYQFKASDDDEHGALAYEISPREYFSIDPRDGMIRVLRDLHNAPDTLELTVRVADSGRPPLKSEAKIQMALFSTDLPQFTRQDEKDPVTVGTSMTPGTVLRQLVAGPTVAETDKILYRLVDSVNGMFEIRDGGVLVLARRPLNNEANRDHQLNVTAENSKGTDSIQLPIYVEGRLSGTTTPSASSSSTQTSCQFAQKVYRAQVKENSQPRTAAVRVQAGCQEPNRKFRYAFHQPTQEFEIDSQSGQIYTSKSLDRETKSSYFLIVNVIEQNRMMKRQSDAAVEQAASKLSPWQALIVVTIVDENDNSPVFLHLLDDSTLSAVVDRNANVMSPIIHLQARDLDIFPPSLRFGLDGDGVENFYVNETNGLVQLARSLEKNDVGHFELQATVSDGAHVVKVPLNVYTLSVDTNVVQLTKDTPHSDIDPADIERKLTDVLGVDTRILVAQPLVSDDGVTDPRKSHVFVYALEDSDRKPMDRDRLKGLLMDHSDGLHPLHISSVSLLSTAGSAGPQTLLTVILLIVLIALLLFICALIVFCAKRRSKTNSGAMLEGSYMINSVGSGPRPYDVENISRATAQTVLAGRPLPDPQEHRIDVSSDSTDVALERDDTTREFSNSVRERPSHLL
ncbi:unnamed protein product [Caenorhabditis sp. 36 PRJEB53466]|nr:unnamed protein product [Caenorhabditis sp. 36 PRJEB53466]